MFGLAFPADRLVELGHRLARSMRALLLDRGLLAQARSRLTTTQPDHG
jgi:hypothetical protein